MAATAAITPSGSTACAAPSSITATPIAPATPPASARSRGRWPSTSHASPIIASGDAAMTVEATPDGSRRATA